MRNAACVCLCFILLFSAFGSSCAEEPPANEDYSNATVTYQYEYKDELVTHERVGADHWWDFERVYSKVGIVGGYKVGKETKPWTPDMLPDIEPNSTVKITKTNTYSRIKASPAVSDFLERGDQSKKDFVLLFVGAKIRYFDGYHQVMTDEKRNEWLEQSCALFYVDGETIGNTGHILWRERDADQIIALNKWLDAISAAGPQNRPYVTYGWDFSTEGVLVCFLEEVEALYGVTFEQADILYEKGYLDAWCTATIENSPLYGLSPAEIAAYIAAHPEILEE